MTDTNIYLNSLVSECKGVFAERLLYIGLQGSYMRGEANENSDIDIMMILDRLSADDMDTYRNILIRLGQYDKSCGFICGRDEITRWNPLEVCQLIHTTKDVYGSLSEYLPEASEKDEINYVKFSLGNLYHELCHRYIHTDRIKNAEKFRGTCKALFFLIQNIYYLESGTFVISKEKLKELVTEDDRDMLMMSELPDEYDFERAFCQVLEWCQKTFIRIDIIDKQYNQTEDYL